MVCCVHMYIHTVDSDKPFLPNALAETFRTYDVVDTLILVHMCAGRARTPPTSCIHLHTKVDYKFSLNACPDICMYAHISLRRVYIYRYRYGIIKRTFGDIPNTVNYTNS